MNSTIKDYYTLLKPGVMALIVFTSLTGFLLADGEKDIFLSVLTVFTIALASGGSASINMWYDRDIDAIMKRTKTRPIPQGRIISGDALFYGILLCIFALLISFLSNNLLTTILLASAIIFYVFIYTMWLKRKTAQNIVIGGAAGAFPPLISYVSITNQINLEGFLLFLIIFLWTPPHFWSLALYRNSDYKKANIPMLPVIKGEKITLNNILFYSILLISSTYLLYFFSSKMGIIFLILTSIINLYFLYYIIKLYKNPNDKNSLKTFFSSIFYLFLIFSAIIIDSIF